MMHDVFNPIIFDSLKELNQQSPLPQKDSDDLYSPGMILGNYFYVTDKPGGVEPGHLVIKINKKFAAIVNILAIEALRKLDPSNNKLPENSHNVEYCRQILTDYPEIAAEIANELCKLWKKNEYPLEDNLWLIKTDYSVSWRNKVTPPIARLANTNAIKNLGDKSKRSLKRIFDIDDDMCTPSLFENASHSLKQTGATLWKFGRLFTSSSERREANLGNIIENLGNDFFREVLNFPAQDQRMILGTYNDKFPKIMTVCKWANGLKTFKGQLAGSSDKPGNYANYLVKIEKNKNGETQFIKDYRGHIQSDNSISHLGAMYLPLILACDRDAIGSKGDNRGRIGDDLFIFDCGKTSFKDTLINDLQDNFEFKNKRKIFKKFKNFSLFYNTPFSEKMMGLFLLYQTLTTKQKNQWFSKEKDRIEFAIKTYVAADTWFAKQIRLIKAGSFTDLFDKYIAQFESMYSQANGNKLVEKEYAAYVKCLRKLKLQATLNMKKLLLKFKHKLQLSKSEATALDNIEKLTNKTRLLSSDKKVKLQHLVYDGALNYRWNMQKTDDGSLKISTRSLVIKRQRKKILNEFGRFCNTIPYEINKCEKHSKLELTVPANNVNNFITKFSSEGEIIRYKQETNEEMHPSPSLFAKTKTKKVETQVIIIKKQLDVIYGTLQSIKSAKSVIGDTIDNEFIIRYSLITKVSIDAAIIYLMQLQHKLQILMLHSNATTKEVDLLVKCIDKLQIILRNVKTNEIDDDINNKMMRHVNLLYKIYTRINKLHNDLKKPFIFRLRFRSTIQQEIKYLEQIVSVLVNNYSDMPKVLCGKLNKLTLALEKNKAIKILNHVIGVIQSPYRNRKSKLFIGNHSLQTAIAKHNQSVFKLLVQQKQHVEDDPDRRDALGKMHKTIVKNVTHTDSLIVKNYRSAQKLLNVVGERFSGNPKSAQRHFDFFKAFQRSFNAGHWENIYTAIEKSKSFNPKAVLQLIKWQCQLQYFILHNIEDSSPKAWYEVYSCIARLKKITDQICLYSVQPEEKVKLIQMLNLLNQIYQHVNRLYLELKKNFFGRGFRFRQSIIDEIAMLEKTAETIIFTIDISRCVDENVKLKKPAKTVNYTGVISHCIDKKVIKKYNLKFMERISSGKSVNEIISSAGQSFGGVVNSKIAKLKKGLSKKYFKVKSEAHDKTAIKFLKERLLPLNNASKTGGVLVTNVHQKLAIEKKCKYECKKTGFILKVLEKFKRKKLRFSKRPNKAEVSVDVDKPDVTAQHNTANVIKQ